MSDASIRARWLPRLAVRRALEAKAKFEHDYIQKALTEARRADTHPRSELVTVRDASSRKLVLRRAQVAQAERVLARHKAPSAWEVSPQGAAFIAGFEGGASPDGFFRPYRDVVGVWTIGYGHTEGVNANSRPLSHVEAVNLLRDDLNQKYGRETAIQLKAAGWAEPKQHEFDALVSFAYNLGIGIIGSPSTSMGRAVSLRSRTGIAAAFGLYDMAGGRHLPGLARRRAAERRLFESGRYA